MKPLAGRRVGFIGIGVMGRWMIGHLAAAGAELAIHNRSRIKAEALAAPGIQVADAKTGKILWSTRLATSVQGFPITFMADGRQYVAVTTGLGGGSPRIVPARLAPEIRVPTTGQALYVFALPEKK